MKKRSNGGSGGGRKRPSRKRALRKPLGARSTAQSPDGLTAQRAASNARITPAVAKLIWSKSSGICAFAGCRTRLLVEASAGDPAATIGQIAHIVAYSGEGPRAEFDPPGGDRDGDQNLVLMCPTHHTVIDRQPKKWTVEQLIGMKETHERWVRESLSIEEAEADPGPLQVETVHSSVLRARGMPKHVYLAPTSVPENHIKDFIDAPRESAIALPFIVRGDNLIAFTDLTRDDTPFRRAFEGTAQRQDAPRWWRDPDLSNWYVTLLNRALNKLTGRRGLNLDKEHQRYFFEADRDAAGAPVTRTVTYQPLNRNETTKRVAWQPRRRRTGEARNYWIHLAVGLRFHRVTVTEWVLSIRPERRYTRDGTIPLDGKNTGRRSTSTKSHMYNYSVLAELQFWKEYLSQGQPAIMLDFGGQSLVIDAEMMTGMATWPGVSGDQRKFKNTTREWDLFSSYDYHRAIESTSNPDVELPFQELGDLLAMEGEDDDEPDFES